MLRARSRLRSSVRRAQELAARTGVLARRHPHLAIVMAAGMAIRVLIEIAYRPALVFPDTIYYIHYATHPFRPGDIRTTLYSDLIAPAIPLHQLWLIPVIQHLLGLATGVLGYAMLVRFGCRKWLAALAALPLVMDPLQLILEHYILSDTLSVTLMLAVLAALTWQGRQLSRRAAVLTGLLLAASILARVQTGIIVLPVAAYLLAVIRPRRLLLRRAAAMAVALVIPVVGWAFWFHLAYGPFGLSNYTGRWLYGRVAQFADCTGLSLPAYERSLCPTQPASQRYQDFYMWDHHSPQWRYHPPPGMKTGTVAGEWALRIIAHQPVTYARVAGVDYIYGFAPVRGLRGPERYPENYLHLTETFPVFNWKDTGIVLWTYGHTHAEVQAESARILSWYDAAYLPGPLFGAFILIALAAAAGIGPARRSGMRPACLLLGLTAVLVTVPDEVLSTFDWRYQLPQLVFAPLAGGVGVAAFIRRARTSERPGAGEAEAAAAAGPAELAVPERDAVPVAD